jgi:fibrillarin-like pre-rRNA processing protein
MKEKFPGVFLDGRRLATKNTTPGYRVYNEKTARQGRDEYRMWDPYRSKVAAALAKGMKVFPVNKNSRVLYLGASSGTTASHIADIADVVYCVEFSKRMMRELLPVCQRKHNMMPVLADARHPWEYEGCVGDVDVAIQDVAQPDQAGILIRNQETFGFADALLSVKARSISSVGDPKKVVRREGEKLREKFDIVEELALEPYEEDHTLFNLKSR